jgi:hypothetical protein
LPALIILITALAVAGAGSVVAAVFLLTGSAWALLALGLFLIAAATILRRGLKPNG